MIKDILRQSPFFSSLSEEDLDWLTAQSEEITLNDGDTLIREGDKGDAAFILLEGELGVSKISDNQEFTLARNEPGEMIGEMSLLNDSPRMATVKAVQPSRLFRICNSTFQDLLNQKPATALAVLHTVSERMRQNEALLRQSEKMAALGTLTAGLAHEMNNPIAAIRRNTEQLRKALETWNQASVALETSSPSDDDRKMIETLRTSLEMNPTILVELDALKRSDLESELQTWLEQIGLENAWEIAPVLVGASWDMDKTKETAEQVNKEILPEIMNWLAASITLHDLLKEMQVASERVSEIVKSVKAYSYLDQAPVQDVDVREGLENTLVILKHKLGDGIRVKREYSSDVPHIEAYGSALNQVWTNLMDNAIDAMAGSGELTVRTSFENDEVMVEIMDTGPGIPKEIQERIYEPFFTTKAPGKGSGLGLHIAYTIIRNHHGHIQLSSQPGRTIFQVTLPRVLPR